MTTLLLVRHGETDWNSDGRLQGQTDRPLSHFGRRQARRLAEELAEEELEAIYSSDLSRARETADIVGERVGLPVELDRELREKDWGTWEGLTAVERERVELVGESTEAHQERMLRALRRIAVHHPDGGCVLVVTHGGSIRRVQTATLGLALPVVENCGRWQCTCENGVFRAPGPAEMSLCPGRPGGGLEMDESRRTTSEEAQRVGDQIGVDWTRFDLEQFRQGMDVEFEHGSHDPQTDVTHDDPIVTGKIALAHMKEFPDYYVRLERMEAEAEQDWSARGR